MVYKQKCGVCKAQKAKLQKAAEELGASVNFGLVNKDRAELLKETYGATMFPAMFLLKDGKAYKFTNTQGPPQTLIDFINHKHIEAKEIMDIPRKVTWFDMFWRYRSREVDRLVHRIDKNYLKPYEVD
mmetsp:Transcript_17240/g.12310  ORF Transcript_17240/g.12310 Transcript_17240/m.12310 type:complete len:128 (+) Transcript_17240:185-568(+)